MNKSELVSWLQTEYQQWEAFLNQIGPTGLEQPGVNGNWSMKDVVAHLNGWNRRLVAHLQAAGRGEPEPAPPWPAHLQTEDEVNAWIYESNRERSLQEVRNETAQDFQQLLTVLEGLPEDARIEQVHRQGREYYLLWLGEERFQPGEFFDHFHDDHEPDVRAWLARMENE